MSDDLKLALFGTRAFAFTIPNGEKQWIAGHVEMLLASANAIQQLLTEKIESNDDEDLRDILNAHIGATFLTSMALQLAEIINPETPKT